MPSTGSTHQHPRPPPASQSTRAPYVAVFGWTGALLHDRSGKAEGQRVECRISVVQIHEALTAKFAKFAKTSLH